MTDILNNTLNGGQYSKKLIDRVDFGKRSTAVEELINGNVLTQGGVERRHGTELLHATNGEKLYPHAPEIESGSETTMSHVVAIDDRNVIVVPNSAYSGVEADQVFMLDTLTGERTDLFLLSTDYDLKNNVEYVRYLPSINGVVLIPTIGRNFYVIELSNPSNIRINVLPTWRPIVDQGIDRSIVGFDIIDDDKIAYTIEGRFVITEHSPGSYTNILDQPYVKSGAYPNADVRNMSGQFDSGTNTFMFYTTLINSNRFGRFQIYHDGSEYQISPLEVFSVTNTINQFGFNDVIFRDDAVYFTPFDGKECVFVGADTPQFAARVTISITNTTAWLNKDRTTEYGVIAATYESAKTYFVKFVDNSIEYFSVETDLYANRTYNSPAYSPYTGKFTLVQNSGLQPSAMVFLSQEVENEVKNCTHIKTIPFPKAAGTGSDQMVIYCEETILVYDVDSDSLIPVTVTDFVPGVIWNNRPPKMRDHVVLNDTILFTTYDDTIYELKRTYDGTSPVITFKKDTSIQVFDDMSSNSTTTNRVSIPFGSSNVPLVKDALYFPYDIGLNWVGGTGAIIPYKNEYTISDTEVASHKLVVITHKTFLTEWDTDSDGNRFLKLTNSLVEAPNGLRWGVDSEIIEAIDDDLSFVIIPNETDFTQLKADGFTEQRYLAIKAKDVEIVPNGSIETIVAEIQLTVEDTTTINLPNITEADIAGLVGGSLYKGIVSTAYATDTENYIKSGIAKSDGGILAGTTGSWGIDFDEVKNPQKSFDNQGVPFYFSEPNVRVRDESITTSFKETWETDQTVKEIVEIGAVLGQWDFKTSGRWDGSMTLERNSGYGWIQVVEALSNNDYNAIVNDGDEGSNNTQYRLVIDLVTDSGTQTTKAGWTFNWNSMNAFYSSTSTIGRNAFSTWYGDATPKHFESIIFHKSRLWLSYKSTVYASEINNLKEFNSYGLPTDDKPLSYRLADTQSASINWLHVVGDFIVVGTTAGMWSITGSNPSNLTTKRQTNIQTSSVKPINVGAEMFFVDAKKTRIYSTIYDYTSESLNAQEITLYSDGLYDGLIKEITYDGINDFVYIRVGQNDPSPVVNEAVSFAGKWETTMDQLVTMTYDNAQGVLAVTQNKIVPIDWIESNVFGYGGFDSVIQLGDEAYLIRVPKDFDTERGDNNTLRIMRFDEHIYGDYYMNRSTSTVSEIMKFFGNREVFFRSSSFAEWSFGTVTTELINELTNDASINNPLIPERFRTGEIDTSKYAQVFECMFPIEFRFTTFPINFGVGGETTYGKHTNINSIQPLIFNTATGTIGIEGSAPEEYGGVYGTNQNTPSIIDVRKSVISINTNWFDDQRIQLIDSSPAKTSVTGLIFNFTQGK